MKKLLQILFGLLLTLILAYMAFLDVSNKIKDDLLRKTNAMLSETNVRGVTANIEGENLSISRTMVLTGTVISEVERVRIGTLTKNIEGVCHVDNQIEIEAIVAKEPSVIEIPIVKTPTEEVMVKSIPQELLNIVENTAIVVKEKTIPIVSVASTKIITKISSVPIVNQSIIVPVPVKAVNAPSVIRIEKIKL